jgi:(1->4)-alpha-D-glucan 1-alpha-D-glucosylmutase
LPDRSIRIPTATYRLQLGPRLRFDQVAELVDYLAALGVSDCYLSPVFAARAGSEHGYDVVDHGTLNPELGGEAEFRALAARLRERGMGLVLDVVPNHMCIATPDNPWWNDVLENGPSSPYASHFDIDWQPPKVDLANTVQLPILGDQYGRVLESGEIRLAYEAGAFFTEYYDHRLPAAPKSWATVLAPVLRHLQQSLGERDERVLELESIITALKHLPARTETDPAEVRERQREKEIVKRRLAALVDGSDAVRGALDRALVELNGVRGEPRSFDRLEALLADQAYRLSFWRVASDEINYRRFFDVNELAAIRVEDPDVFTRVHALPARLVAEGLVTGLRIDHVDGLSDPLDYLRRLPCGCWVTAEKILQRGEELRADWPVHGTTGYDYLNLVNGLFVEPAAAPILRALYGRVNQAPADFATVVYVCKRVVMKVTMSSELTVLARKLDRISEQHRYSRDFTLNSLQDALAALVASFPVYRSYLRADEEAVSPEDRDHVAAAVRRAKRRNPATSESIFDFIGAVLLRDDPPGLTDRDRADRREFAARFQQLTSPVMAKGFEDTACYRYFPLASLNEVGGSPDTFGVSVDDYHAGNVLRQQRWPASMSATSTHDTKRSEDVRARIDVLSELPERWATAVDQWQQLNQGCKRVVEDAPAPSANDEYLLYQTLVGTCPLVPRDATPDAGYVARIQDYMLKATREAKIHTSWISPRAAYEDATRDFVAAILDPRPDNEFPRELRAFLSAVARPGLLNSLSQLVLKIAAPGVPDFYQGTELWDLSLVDPDNRRPVDFRLRRELLARLAAEGAADPEGLVTRLLAEPEDGRLKLWITSRGLALRAARRELFRRGDYVPLQAVGARARHVIAAGRLLGGEAVVALAGRFFTSLPAPPVGEPAWGDTVVAVPPALGTVFRDALTGRVVEAARSPGGHELTLGAALARLPVALLERVS